MTEERPSGNASDRPPTDDFYRLILHQFAQNHVRESRFPSQFDAYEAAAAPVVGADDTWEIVHFPEPDVSGTVLMRGTGPNTADRSSFEMYPTNGSVR